jgi:putative SOS response-associated peptidase YedK
LVVAIVPDAAPASPRERTAPELPCTNDGSADFFYEWQKLDAKRRQAYAIGMKDGTMFAFAGLWERWKDRSSGNVLETFTVTTTAPNELIERVHDRMPVILKP